MYDHAWSTRNYLDKTQNVYFSGQLPKDKEKASVV
jgi:hypothetical protein